MLYSTLIRPILFTVDPERVHSWVVGGLKLAFAIPGVRLLIGYCTKVNDPKLQREVFGLRFSNPVGIAAGFDKDAQLFNELSALGFGHIEVGTITPKPQMGNPKPRLFRLPKDKGLINRMGFNNQGLDAAVKKLRKRKTTAVIGANLGKNTLTPNETAIEDYSKNFDGLFDVADYFVVNVSCPNITDLSELQDQQVLTAILQRLQEINATKKERKPILLKVSPDLNEKQLDEVIEIVRVTKIDGVMAVNTTIRRDNINNENNNISRIGNGGLSGLPLRERATEVIRYLAEKSGKAFPIIGVGGVFTPQDAIEKLQAGADLIQVYTGFIYEGPMIARRINKGILKAIENGQLK
ncbi:MAG: quinone-dependent dihydroorotate dehydrogenase [Bacteroidales bacterium]|jgi:dihydroorotate dehydrogenase|nr:quinone-dependent dihydroorotate dehydrogenase [Bacteroidales bacterium]MCK9448339.1 quinone-dependent dihydroorotate dehydrogenase [Bacteroidales bacterium]MDD3701658.1 quinone-dependent dihydroorotate dehydrogenase [Bacteroidales bacterium]MDY0370530.1 quinone-dependent dihydroorotate dehydrogenase [Bacteroidales bacterium]